RNQGRRGGPAQGVLDHLLVLRGAEKHADGRSLVRLANVPVERLQIELQLAEVRGLELLDFQLEGDQAIQPSVEEQQVDLEVPPADLDRVVAADKAEIP